MRVAHHIDQLSIACEPRRAAECATHNPCGTSVFAATGEEEVYETGRSALPHVAEQTEAEPITPKKAKAEPKANDPPKSKERKPKPKAKDSVNAEQSAAFADQSAVAHAAADDADEADETLYFARQMQARRFARNIPKARSGSAGRIPCGNPNSYGSSVTSDRLRLAQLHAIKIRRSLSAVRAQTMKSGDDLEDDFDLDLEVIALTKTAGPVLA